MPRAKAKRVLLSSKPDPAGDTLSEARRACRKQALDLLARREHSRLEIKRKLLARSHAKDTVEEVLDALQQEQLLHEPRFVEQFVRSRVSRGRGPTRIRAELIQRGIDDSLIHAKLEEAGCDWVSLAADARFKRFGPDSPTEYRDRVRQARFLQTRGFEYGQIQAALDLRADSD